MEEGLFLSDVYTGLSFLPFCAHTGRCSIGVVVEDDHCLLRSIAAAVVVGRLWLCQPPGSHWFWGKSNWYPYCGASRRIMSILLCWNPFQYSLVKLSHTYTWILLLIWFRIPALKSKFAIWFFRPPSIDLTSLYNFMVLSPYIIQSFVLKFSYSKFQTMLPTYLEKWVPPVYGLFLQVLRKVTFFCICHGKKPIVTMTHEQNLKF